MFRRLLDSLPQTTFMNVVGLILFCLLIVGFARSRSVIPVDDNQRSSFLSRPLSSGPDQRRRRLTFRFERDGDIRVLFDPYELAAICNFKPSYAIRGAQTVLIRLKPLYTALEIATHPLIQGDSNDEN